MPPHTTLHYTMPPNTTNSKSTATTANNGTTQMNTNNKSVPTPTKTSRQRSATSGSSYVFAPSWLANLNNKSGPSPTVLNSAYVPTSEEKSVKEVGKGVGASKKEGFGINRQIKEGLGKDGSSSLNRSSINGITSHSSSRSRSRDFSGSRLSFGETENYESSNKAHGRSRSVSQVNHSHSITSSSSNFDRNFPILAKKNLSVDLPAKNTENIWANSDKSKLLSPTTTPSAEEHTKFNIPNTDNEPELERRMSLVPKAGIGKLDGKRANRAVKCKVVRSMSLDSGARGPNGSSDFGFGVGTGILNNRSFGQTQNSRSYTTTVKPTNIQSQRPRAASISSSNGIKKLTVTSPRVGGFGQSTISGRRSSINNNSKYLWSNNTMGKMGYFKILPDEEEEDEEEEEGFLNDRKGDVNYLPNIDESVENVNNNLKDVSVKDEVIDNQNPIGNSHHSIDSQNVVTSSIESEEKFLLQLGWQKPRNKDNDNNDWAITDEEKRFFINLIRALNGISISDDSANNELSFNEINCAKEKWATLVKSIKIINGGDKIFNTGYQSSHSSVTKHVTFSDED